jgi:hypothetical protein
MAATWSDHCFFGLPSASGLGLLAMGSQGSAQTKLLDCNLNPLSIDPQACRLKMPPTYIHKQRSKRAEEADLRTEYRKTPIKSAEEGFFTFILA